MSERRSWHDNLLDPFRDGSLAEGQSAPLWTTARGIKTDASRHSSIENARRQSILVANKLLAADPNVRCYVVSRFGGLYRLLAPALQDERTGRFVADRSVNRFEVLHCRPDTVKLAAPGFRSRRSPLAGRQLAGRTPGIAA